MVLPLATMLMAGGVYRKVKQDMQDEEDRALKTKREAEDRDYMLGQRQRLLREQGEADALQASMKAAAAPTSVQSGEVYQPTVDDEGNAMPANPTAGTFKVAGQRFADEGTAKKAADAYNSPVATMRRQAQVLTGAGKTADAAQLGQQADTLEANSALKEAGSLLMQGGWDAVPQVYARYNDGMSARVEKNDKGGATVIQVDDKTGKEVGRREFEDLPHLFASIAGRFDPSKWVADEQRRGERAEDARRWNAEQGVREKTADSTAALRAAQAEAASARAQASMVQAQAAMERAAAAKAKNDPQAEGPNATFDEKTAADIAKDIVKKEAEEAALAGTKLTAAQIAARKDAIVETLRQTHTNRFVAGQVQRVLTMAQSDPAIYAAEYGKALKIMPQAELARMGFAPPAAAGAPKQPGAAPAAAAPVAPTAPRPAAAPAASMLNTSGADKQLQAINAEARAALDALAQKALAAKQQLAAAAKSGDPQALATYSQAVTQATEALKAEAAKRLGNGAPAYLQTIPL